MNGEYLGGYVVSQAEGAIPNGEIIIKTNSMEGDATPDGTPGKVIGSLRDPEVGLCYFVEWQDKKGFAVAVMELKIRRQTQYAPEGTA